MMMYDNISSLAHSIEDLFFYLEENQIMLILTPIWFRWCGFYKNEFLKFKWNGL